MTFSLLYSLLHANPSGILLALFGSGWSDGGTGSEGVLRFGCAEGDPFGVVLDVLTSLLLWVVVAVNACLAGGGEGRGRAGWVGEGGGGMS